MVMPKKFTRRYWARFDDEGGDMLEAEAKIMGVKPGKAIRIMVEHQLKALKKARQGDNA